MYMNVFTMPFEHRLEEWSKLRQSLSDETLEKTCVAVDDFWQQCPLNTYYLHPHDMKEWPTPWQLLHDNTYCFYACSTQWRRGWLRTCRLGRGSSSQFSRLCMWRARHGVPSLWWHKLPNRASSFPLHQPRTPAFNSSDHSRR